MAVQDPAVLGPTSIVRHSLALQPEGLPGRRLTGKAHETMVKRGPKPECDEKPRQDDDRPRGPGPPSQPGAPLPSRTGVLRTFGIVRAGGSWGLRNGHPSMRFLDRDERRLGARITAASASYQVLN